MEETTLGEVIQRMFEYKMEDVMTALPGIILKVHGDGEDLLLDVQPSVSYRAQTDEVTHRPVILNVPVQMPSSKLAGILFPVAVGDTVMLVFASDGIDNFKYGDGKPTPPNDFRRFNIRDCVAIPGVYPKSASTNRPPRHKFKHSPQDLVVYHNLGTANEVEVRLKKDDSKLVINCKHAEVNAEDDMTVNTKLFTVNTQHYKINTTTAESNGTWRHNGSYILNGIVMETHRHGGVQTGGGTTQGPQ